MKNVMKFETKYINREKTKYAEEVARNVFSFNVLKQRLEREGYKVIPARYRTNEQGYLTEKVWLWKAFKPGHLVEIHTTY